MHRTWKRWSVSLGCVVAALAVPVSLLAQEKPAEPKGSAAGKPAAAAPKAGSAAKPGATVKPPPPADPIAVLKAIPADATAFAAVRNIWELDAHIQALAEKLGLPLAAIGFPGPLEFVKQNAGITEGLDDNSGIAIALLNCAEIKEASKVASRVVILIPTSNAEALTKTFGGKKEGDQITLQMMGEPSVAAVKNGFLVVGQNADSVKAAVQAKGEGMAGALSPERLAAYKTQDAFAWASFRGISKEIREEVVNTFKGLMAMAQGGGNAGAMDSMTAPINKFAEESQQLSLGLTVDPKAGLKVVFNRQVKPDSPAARQIAAMKAPTEPMLLGLPDEQIVVVLGSSGSGGDPSQAKQVPGLVDVLLSEKTLGEQVDAGKLRLLKESIGGFLNGLDQFGLSLSALPSDSEDGLVGVAFVAKVANSQRAQAEMRSLMNLGKELGLKTAQQKGSLTEEDAKKATEAIQWKENAEKVSGAAVDHFVVDLTKMPGWDNEKIEKIKSAIGPEGILARVATVGPNHLVVTFGGGAKRFAQIVDLVQKGQAPLADRKSIKMVADRQPPAQERLLQLYVGLDGILTLVMNISAKEGQPFPIPLAMKETAPLTFTLVHPDKTTNQLEFLFPVELGQAAMEMAQPFIQMMLMGRPGGGAGGPGGPGGLLPPPGPDSGGK